MDDFPIKNFENEFDIVFRNLSKLLTENNKMNKPAVVYLNYPNLDKHNIQSRDFKTPYFNEEDKIGGNLYSWIHQSFSVLWEVNKESNNIVIFTKTTEKLGLRFATLLKMEKKLAHLSVFKLLMYLYIAELSLKSFGDSTIINNSEKEIINTSLENQYIFSLSKLALFKDIETLEVYHRFTKMFAKDDELFNIA